jgi:hypothetical protein
MARLNGSKEGPGNLDRRDRAAHEFGRAMEPGMRDRKLEKDAEGGEGARGRTHTYIIQRLYNNRFIFNSETLHLGTPWRHRRAKAILLLVPGFLGGISVGSRLEALS